MRWTRPRSGAGDRASDSSGPGSTSAGWRRRESGYWLAALFCLALLALFWRLELRYDAHHYYEPVRSLLIDGDINAYNERAFWTERRWHGYWEKELFAAPSKFLGFMHTEDLTPTGYKHSFFPAGNIVMLLPMAVLGNIAAKLATALGWDQALDGYSFINLAVTSFGVMALGMTGLVMAWIACTRLYSSRSATFALIAVIATHNVVPYLAIDTLYSHGASLFLISAFLYVWIRTREQGGLPGYFLLGLIGGVSVATRYQDITLMVIPLADAAINLVRHRDVPRPWTQRLWRAGAFGVGLLTALLPQAALWSILYGRVLISPTTMGASGIPTFHPFRPDLAGLLVSNQHGLFSWTPFVLLAFIGLLLTPVRHRRLGIYLIVIFLLQTYYNSCRSEWWNLGYGIRRYSNYGVFFALGFAAWHHHLKRRWLQALSWALLVVAACWNVVLMAQYYDGINLYAHGPLYPKAIGRLIPYALREYRMVTLPPEYWWDAMEQAGESLIKRGSLFESARWGAERGSARGWTKFIVQLGGLIVAVIGPFLLRRRRWPSIRSPAWYLAGLLPLSVALWLAVYASQTREIWAIDLNGRPPAGTIELEKLPTGRLRPFPGKNAAMPLPAGSSVEFNWGERRKITDLHLNVEVNELIQVSEETVALRVMLARGGHHVAKRMAINMAEVASRRGDRALLPGEPERSERIAVFHWRFDPPVSAERIELTAPKRSAPVKLIALGLELAGE